MQSAAQTPSIREQSISMKTLLGKGCEKWLYRYKQNSVKKGTFKRLETSLIFMNRYYVSQVRLMDLRTEDVQNYINQMAEDGYALTTIKKQYNLITGYIKFLLGEGAPIHPVYLNVKLPNEDTIVHKKKEIVSYSKPEVKRLTAVCEASDDFAARAAILLMETGMRVGELLALKWEDVKWDRQAVFIHRTLVNHQSRVEQIIQDSAKSRSSNRTIPLSTKAMKLVSQMFDEASSTDGLIFPLPDDPNESIGYNALRAHLQKLCKEANVKYCGLHVFRHTFATNCYYRGVDIKMLSKFLGHSSVSVTYNTYIHLYGDTLEALREVVM